MKIYIAGRNNERSSISEVEELAEILGHEITFKWWLHDDTEIKKGNLSEIKKIASMEYNAVMEADILVLVWNPGLLGGLIETGMAIGTDKDVFVLGAERTSVFWNLPNVHLVRDIIDLERRLRDDRYQWLL